MIITVTRQQRVPVIRSGKSHGYFWSMEWYDSQTPGEIMLRVYVPNLVRRLVIVSQRISDTECYLRIPSAVPTCREVCFYSVPQDVRVQRVSETGWLETGHCCRSNANQSGPGESVGYRTHSGDSMPVPRGVEVPWSAVLESILPTAEYVCQQLRKREESVC